MTIEEKLEAFKNSKCPPVVIIPGFMGTKLEFRMKNCTEFKTYHQNILDSCGWTNCEAKELKKFPVWVNVKFDLQDMFSRGNIKQNKSEKVHIPNLIRSIEIEGSEIKIENRKGCLGNLLRTYYVKENSNDGNATESENKRINFEAVNLKGAEVRVASTTKTQCGSNTVSRILGDAIPNIRAFNGFGEINDHLVKMGYISGVNLFYRPYDFRMPHKNILRDIDRAVKLAYQITKKKPILIGHSLGGILAYKYALRNNKLIQEIMSIGSPFLGTSGSIQKIFTLDRLKFQKSLNIFGLDIKVTAKLDKYTSNMQRVTFPFPNFVPKPFYNDEIDKEISRINHIEVLTNSSNTNELENIYEEFLSSEGEGNFFLKYLYNIFPKIYADCRSTFYSIKSTTLPHTNPVCKINYQDIGGSGILNFDGEEISINSVEFREKLRETLKELIIEANYNVHEIFKLDPEEFTEFLINEIEGEKEFAKFKNPKVPFTFVYANHLETPYKFHYKNKTFIEMETGPGDGTVNGISQIYPGLRWLYENHKDDESSSSPIHFVEYCADYKESNLAKYDKSKTQYISISCDCIDQHNLNSQENCNHSAVLADNNLISFISEFIAKGDSRIENIAGYEVLYEKKFNSKMVCSHLN
jgi:hypothetical protein